MKITTVLTTFLRTRKPLFSLKVLVQKAPLDCNKKKKRKENYAGSKTFPAYASTKEKETHWPEVP